MTRDELEDDEVDLLGVFELALRGVQVELDEQRKTLALDQNDALVAFRDQAFAIAVEGDGQAVTADELFARSDCDEDARAHLHALFDRAPAYEIRSPSH